MDKLNFYYLDKLSGHYAFPWTKDLDQSFLKNNLSSKFSDSNLIDSHFEEVAKHLGNFYESGKEKIKTDISGIIVPICHGDHNDYFHVIVSIPGDFERDLKSLWKSNGIYQDHPKDREVLNKRANLTYSFMKKTFGIPVFEAHEFLPGYREVPFPKGKRNMDYEERIVYVENAFNEWLDKNFY